MHIKVFLLKYTLYTKFQAKNCSEQLKAWYSMCSVAPEPELGSDMQSQVVSLVVLIKCKSFSSVTIGGSSGISDHGRNCESLGGESG